MPTYSVGASYLLYSGYPKTSTSKGHKDDIYASFIPEGLRIPLHFYFLYINTELFNLNISTT